MDALGLSTTRSNAACSSVEDLQGQLHELLAARTTDARAEHVSPSFELLSHAILHLPADSENGADAAQPRQPPVTRTVVASETVQNQPTDDPVLQKAVAKHISNAIGAVDRGAWAVRQVTRGAQGWQFTYICKDSLQAWNRAHAKNPDRPVLGSYSGPGGLDPINLSRPAFDCRGTLTIAFSKSSRGIVVKYEHTPLHKTVAQLVEQLVPAPVPVPIASGNNGSQRTPKAKRPRPSNGEEGSRRKKTPKAVPLLADGEGSNQKKRTPRAKRPRTDEGENGESSKKRRRKSGKAPVADMGVPEDVQNTPQGPVQSNSTADKAGYTGILNVPPAEAERRRQTAFELLRGRGIDPATLSSEQFNIFANQAPNLQSASLDMLAKYGAERLRIVHPEEKEQAGSSNSTPATGQTTNTSPATVPAPSSGNTATPTKKSLNKRKSGGPLTEVSIGNGAVVPLEQDGEIGTTESSLKPKGTRARKTRGRCDTCKQRKVQCTKEHPSCSVCIDAGIDCVYLPPKPRRKSEKSAETVEHEDSDPGEQDGAQHEVGNAGQTSLPDSLGSHAIMPPQPAPDIENEEFIPDPNILAGPVEHHQPPATHPPNIHTGNYYEESHSEIGFPHMSSALPTAPNTTMPGLTYSETQPSENAIQPAAGATFTSTSVHSQQSRHGLPVSQPPSAPTEHQTQSASSRRKSLPTSQSKQTPIPPPTIPAHTSTWNTSPSIHQPTATSPRAAHQQAAKRSKPRKSRAEPEQQGHESLNQAAPPQSTQYQSPMTRSPYQSSAHVNPRQSHRSRTKTPVAANPRPPPQAPSSTHQPTTNTSYTTPTTSSSASNYNPYARYDNNSHGNDHYTDTGNDHNSSRVTYESSSYQASTVTTAPSYSSMPSYDYGRSSGTANPLSQALNSSAGYSGATSTTANKWPTSQTRGQNDTSSSAYSLPSTSASVSHGYSTRSSDTRASAQNASYSQSQSQNYSSYPPQQSNLHQQSQQNWYGFTAANSSNQASYTSNRQSSHATHRPNVPAYSSQYSGHDDQAIYDLLRTGSSNH